jgi:hypothetical protein
MKNGFCYFVKVLVLFCPLSRFPKERFFGGSQSSFVYSCNKSKIKMMVSVENCWNDTDRAGPKFLLKDLTCATSSTAVIT